MHASRIGGLGGSHPAPDPTYVFRTPPLKAPAGVLVFSIAFEALRATRGSLLIEIVAGESPQCKQVALRTLSLAALADEGGATKIVVPREKRDIYAVSADISDDTDAAAKALTIGVAIASSERGIDDIAANGMILTPRLTAIEAPSFARPTSQTTSAGQLRESVFTSVCRQLEIDATAESWQAAFVYQTAQFQLGALAGMRAFGAGMSVELIAQAFASRGVEIVATASADPAGWPPADQLDFTWTIADQTEWSADSLTGQAELLLSRVRAGGVIVLIFPIEHGRMQHERCAVPRRGDVEILALKMLARGHSIAQLKFRPGNRPWRSGTRASFGLVVRRGVD